MSSFADWIDIRRRHLLAAEDKLAELKTDFAVVDDAGSLGYNGREKETVC